MALVRLHKITYLTPDGRPLFEDLDLAFPAGRCGLIGQNGSGKSTLLRLVAGELVPAAGTVAVEGRMRVLRQETRPEVDTTVADLFGLAAPLGRLQRALAGNASPEELADLDWSLDERLAAALAAVGLAGCEPGRPLTSLSGGERTRAALAALTFDRPDVILLDEPTNNLDGRGRDLVADMLHRFPGSAIVASHDRSLLGNMDRIVELSGVGAQTYGGNWHFYSERRAEERSAAGRRLSDAERALDEARRRIQTARERKARRDGRGHRSRAGGDNSKMLFDARKERAENTKAGASRLEERRMAEARSRLEDARARVERAMSLSARIAGARVPSGEIVLAFNEVAYGYGPDAPVFDGLSFTLSGPERIAVAGPNGSGKSTVLKLAAGRLEPTAGGVRRPAASAMFDQDVALVDRNATILDNFRRLNRQDDDNACRAALARFQFRAEDAMRPAASLSGGELLRAGLACVLAGRMLPELIILDEPTNHLDICSIEAVEAGLEDFGGALLVASHDEAFLAALGIDRRIALGAPPRD